MNNSPRVTVLMSVYNGEKFLRESINSILNQTYTDFEFLIINDKSMDSSLDVIMSYDDSRILLINNPENLGLTKNLNKGLKLARGEYIARQDADDISEPDRIAKQVSYMDTNPQLALLGTWYREIDADGAILANKRLPSEYTELRWALLFYCPFVHSAIMYRKSDFIDHIGMYDENFVYAQDYELWLRAARYRHITNYKEYLVRYRVHANSMTSTYTDQKSETVLISARAIGSLLGWNLCDLDYVYECTKKIFEVLYGALVNVRLEELLMTTELIWQLHKTFCNNIKLNKDELQLHNAKLRSWLSRRFIRIAYQYCKNGNIHEAQQVYILGLQYKWLNFFSTKSAQFLFEWFTRQVIYLFS